MSIVNLCYHFQLPWPIDLLLALASSLTVEKHLHFRSMFLQVVFFLLLTDEEKPRFSGCPSDIYDSIIGSSKVITWTPPVSTDNVGVVKVTSTSKPGDTFKIGPLVVYYHAYDAAGNIAVCSFEIILRSKLTRGCSIRIAVLTHWICSQISASEVDNQSLIFALNCI